jgi:hypothetical protein
MGVVIVSFLDKVLSKLVMSFGISSWSVMSKLSNAVMPAWSIVHSVVYLSPHVGELLGDVTYVWVGVYLCG